MTDYRSRVSRVVSHTIVEQLNGGSENFQSRNSRFDRANLRNASAAYVQGASTPSLISDRSLPKKHRSFFIYEGRVINRHSLLRI